MVCAVPASRAPLAMISPSPDTGPTWPNGRFFLLSAFSAVVLGFRVAFTIWARVKDNWPNMADAKWTRSIHDHYGTTPHGH